MTKDKNASKELADLLVTRRTVFRMLVLDDCLYGPGFTAEFINKEQIPVGSFIDCLLVQDEVDSR